MKTLTLCKDILKSSLQVSRPLNTTAQHYIPTFPG